MIFVIEIPTIMENANGNHLSLTIGGVKSYALDNLYGKRSNGDQHFQLFIGFQNRVCCNMCVWTDGIKEQLGIKNVSQLKLGVENLIRGFDATKQLSALKTFGEIELSETEFAQIVGRTRMHKHLPEESKIEMPPILLGDQQMSAVVRDFYVDENFGSETGGNISLWKFYNLLTGANKSSYIDSFLERGVNAHDFSNGIAKHKMKQKHFWYMG